MKTKRTDLTTLMTKWLTCTHLMNPIQIVHPTHLLSDPELLSYANFPPPSLKRLNFEPLMWWKDIGKNLFPSIALVAEKYLSVASSTAHVERLFQDSKDIGSDDRQLMKEITFARNVFLEANAKHLEQKWF